MKNILRACVRRKVTVAMLTLTAVIFGVMAWFKLDREFMPALEFPQLSVLTAYPNASSQEVENLVTKIIEEAAGTVKNVHRIHSSSREGISIVSVEFLWGTPMDLASLNLREKVDLAKAKLPRDSGEPRIEKFNPFALPVLTLSLSGPRSDYELLTLARRPVAELLEKTRGVAAVSLTGGREREILVELDQAKLSARNIPLLEVGQAIARANITYPAGDVKDKTFEYVVRVLGAFDHVDDLNHIVVAMDRSRLSSALSPIEARRKKQQSGDSREAAHPLSLSALGDVKDTFGETASYSRYDGRATISIAILKQADANVVRVADEVKAKLADIRAKVPHDVQINVVYDQSLFVKAGIQGMVRDSLLGGFLAFLVLLLFLGNLQDAFVVSTAIPISILAALFIMYSKGMTLNTITLAGLAIGIGHLVDGAIVVQENIARHRAKGVSAEQAAADGGAEVFGAVTTSIFTSVAVFLPLIFVVGVIGQVFRDLSWAVIFSQLVSLVVAFTLIPMMASLTLKKTGRSTLAVLNEPISAFHQAWAKRSAPWVAAYERLLNFSLEQPGKILQWVGVGCLVSLAILYVMPKAVFPDVEGREILMRLDMPVGTALDKTNSISLRVEAALKDDRDIAHCSATVGSLPQEGLQPLGAHQVQWVLELQRHHTPSTRVIQRLKTRLKNIPLDGGRLAFSEQGGTFSFMDSQGAPVVIEVKGYDLKILEAAARRVSAQLQDVRGLTNIRSSLSESAPELQLEVNRDALANLSLSVSDLAETVLTGVRGKVVSKFREGGKEFDIRMRLRPEDRQDIRAIESLFVHSPLDVDVPIRSVAYIHDGRGPSEITRYDQQRTVMVSADLVGRSINAVAVDIAPILNASRDEKDISLTLTGESARVAESISSLQIVLLLSIAFVFMIMASQFESLWQPLSILFTIPLALIGLAPALVLTGHKLTAMAGMGMVLLAGIVVNNGIVLVDFVNQSRAQGLSLRDALRSGCHTRLRPILMTALTTILGMLPLAFGLGEGSDMQAPMAIVVVSGLFVSTLLTLVVLPAIFVVMEERLLHTAGRPALPETLKDTMGCSAT